MNIYMGFVFLRAEMYISSIVSDNALWYVASESAN